MLPAPQLVAGAAPASPLLASLELPSFDVPAFKLPTALLSLLALLAPLTTMPPLTQFGGGPIGGCGCKGRCQHPGADEGRTFSQRRTRLLGV
jgi:hypothetical protein